MSGVIKTRIIVSRCSDECDAEYILRACRQRTDGRLKRHASCDDLRAWVNDNCIKHEHLVDIMSDGEFLGDPPFRLFGRFVPVPILFKLTQSTTLTETEDEGNEAIGGKESGVKNSKSESIGRTKSVQVKRSKSENRSKDSKCTLQRLEWEKNQLEKKLCECTCLLNTAVGRLEKIDILVGCPRDEWDNARNEEIQRAFYKSKVECTCPPARNPCENLSPSRSYMKKLRESIKCTELMRKISDLRAKLKKVQECRQEISQQIKLSQVRAETCGSPYQVTELYNRREQAHVKRLQKKLEKLIAERGKLLSEMCQTLSRLNSMKKTSRSTVSSSKGKPKNYSNYDQFQSERPRRPTESPCGCTCSEHVETTDSEQAQCSSSSSGESNLNGGYADCRSYNSNRNNSYDGDGMETPCTGETPDDESVNSDRYGDEYFENCETGNQINPNSTYSSATFSLDPCLQKQIQNQVKDENLSLISEKTRNTNSSCTTKKSKVQFSCSQPSCKRILNADDLSAYENSVSPAQQALILGAIKNIQNRRPSTSPTTKKERTAAEKEQLRLRGQCSQRTFNVEDAPERQIKSETTMKEIEKTLRNYEQRLNQLDSLECRVEEMKKQSSEASQYKQDLERLKCEMKRQNAMERERSRREMTELCSENSELRRQLQQLTAKFEAQFRKMQSLRCGMAKARELECEAEELKKELSEYRDSCEQQRKCISKWESVVAVQRTEIENLMNHIKKLTTMREENCQAKKCVQRSRSYSPDVKPKGAAYRGKAPARNCRQPSEEEDVAYCCNEYLQEETRRRSQQRTSERVYCCPPPTRGMEWCN